MKLLFQCRPLWLDDEPIENVHASVERKTILHAVTLDPLHFYPTYLIVFHPSFATLRPRAGGECPLPRN